MKSTRYDGTDLRRILCGMVTDPVVCSRIAGRWRDGGLFESAWANMVGGWAVRHLRKYGEPPAAQLRAIYDEWAARADSDQEVVRGVERFLVFLSEEHERSAPATADWVLDLAGRHFNKVRIRRAIEESEAELEAGRVDEAGAKLSESGRVELGVGSLVKPAEEYDPWVAAFDPERRRPLVVYAGGLGKFFGDSLCRDSLIAFMGPDKVGKSMFMLDVAFRAVKSRCRVAYFECGDMGQDGVMLRMGQRAACRPLKVGFIDWPTGFGEDKKPVTEKREFESDLSASEAYRAFRRVTRGRDMFRLSCHANSTLGVEGLRSIVQSWAREGWVADCIVIDYADILAPPTGVRETLDQIDATWRSLRRLSQELHCLVVTATQSNAAAYADKARTLDRKHFSGRKTKLAHVNGMVGINVSEGDKEAGTCRLNWVVRRDAQFNGGRFATAAGCWDVMNPAVKSIF